VGRQAQSGLRDPVRARDRDPAAGCRDHVGPAERRLAKGILMTRLRTLLLISVAISCASAPRPFRFRAPMVSDTDTHPVSLPCRPDPSAKEGDHVRCAPAEY